ncbi:hypothetical protein COTS27_01071 [Spirochaetota bacterium]|nr:hypothetical protein COTS27_01071 [Spirochaetota bacterium]
MVFLKVRTEKKELNLLLKTLLATLSGLIMTIVPLHGHVNATQNTLTTLPPELNSTLSSALLLTTPHTINAINPINPINEQSLLEQSDLFQLKSTLGIMLAQASPDEDAPPINEIDPTDKDLQPNSTDDVDEVNQEVVDEEQGVDLTAKKKAKKHRHVIGLASGLIFGDTRDIVVSSLYRFMIGGGGRLHYEYIAPFQYHFVQIEGSYSQLLVNYQKNGKFNSLASIKRDVSVFINLAYGSQFNVFSKNIIDLYVGFTIEANVDAWIVESFLSYGWNGTFTVGPSLMLKLNPAEKHTLRFNYYLPIIGTLSRPLYNFYNFEFERILESSPNIFALLIDILTASTHFFSWKDAFRTTLAANYEWLFSTHVGLLARYNVSLDYYGLPPGKSKTSFTHQVYLGFSFYW